MNRLVWRSKETNAEVREDALILLILSLSQGSVIRQPNVNAWAYTNRGVLFTIWSWLCMGGPQNKASKWLGVCVSKMFILQWRKRPHLIQIRATLSNANSPPWFWYAASVVLHGCVAICENPFEPLKYWCSLRRPTCCAKFKNIYCCHALFIDVYIPPLLFVPPHQTTPTPSPVVVGEEPEGDHRRGVWAVAPVPTGAAEKHAGGVGGGHGAHALRHRAQNPALQPAAARRQRGHPDPAGATGRERPARLLGGCRPDLRKVGVTMSNITGWNC